MNRIYLSQDDVNLIRREGEASFPEECCGFLFGKSVDEARSILEVIPMRNEQDVNRARRFLISPEEFRRAEFHARETAQDLLGFYHTHPDHPAIPSEFDREHALPFYSYVILSVRSGIAAEMRSWQLELERDLYFEETILINANILQ